MMDRRSPLVPLVSSGAADALEENETSVKEVSIFETGGSDSIGSSQCEGSMSSSSSLAEAEEPRPKDSSPSEEIPTSSWSFAGPNVEARRSRLFLEYGDTSALSLCRI